MTPADAKAGREAIGRAAHLIRDGGLVAFPTETVYGLGADAASSAAVARIFEAKGRPRFNPLISHVASFDMADREGLFTPLARDLAERFWPGPLTLVVPRSAGGTICDLACAGLSSVALRMPHHLIALGLIEAAGTPVAAPSANRSGSVSPTTAAHVAGDLGGSIDGLIDGGPCLHGMESTIVGCVGDGFSLLRPGSVSREEIEAAVGRPLDSATPAITAPGMLASHYAPRALLRLDATFVDIGETGLDFAGRLGAALDLSPTGDLVEAAARLYAALRTLDASGATAIAVAPVPNTGLGEAINDRLLRAAAPRA